MVLQTALAAGRVGDQGAASFCSWMGGRAEIPRDACPPDLFFHDQRTAGLAILKAAVAQGLELAEIRRLRANAQISGP